MMEQNKHSDVSLSKYPHPGSVFRLGIAKKLFIGYVPLVALIIAVAAFTLSNLENLNKINASIVSTDLSLIDTGDKIIDSILGQELYGRRYVILNSPEMLTLYWNKSAEFEKQLNILRGLPDQKGIPVDRLAEMHDNYNKTFLTAVDSLSGSATSMDDQLDALLKKRAGELIDLIKKIMNNARRSQNEKNLAISQIGTRAFRITWILSTFGIFLGIVAAVLITRNISTAVSELKYATTRIAEGKFDHMSTVKNRDELGELSAAFNIMAARLKRLEEMYLDASPLTRLPGGVAIENILNKRLEAGTPLVFCHIDLDNFKSFSDRYGYARGSEVIKATARIIEDAVFSMGIEEDFIGHIGGDDFVVISSTDRYEGICKGIIDLFDRTIPQFYSEEDRVRGYIPGKTRQGEEVNFPIMTISIAVVINNDHKFTSPIEIGEVAAELKDHAKSLSGSTYVIDKRKDIFHEVEYNSDAEPDRRKRDAKIN